MPHEDDTPLSDEELALAKKGEALIAAAVADTQAPQSLRESIERERERAQAAPRASFWRRHGRVLAATATAVAVLAGRRRDSRGAPESRGRRRWPRSRRPRGSRRPGRLRRRAAATRPSSRPGSGRSRSRTGRRASAGRPSAVARTTISGRTVKTVFYRNPDGARLGYSIVAGEPLGERPPGREVTRAGNTYHVARDGRAHPRHLDPAGPHLRDRRLLDRPASATCRSRRLPQRLIEAGRDWPWARESKHGAGICTNRRVGRNPAVACEGPMLPSPPCLLASLVAGVLALGLSSSALADSASLSGTASVSAGAAHSCAIRADGQLACWGDDSSGQVSEAPEGEFLSVSAGGSHSCAIRADGQLACWGDDSSGQVSEAPEGEFLSVSAGGSHSCAIRADGQLACWGDDSSGQVSEAPEGEFLSVSAGGSHSCAIRADGELACWGDDSSGQASGGDAAYHLHKHHNEHHHHHYKDDRPEFLSVSAGDAHTCAIDDDSEVLCWGDDSSGQVSEAPEGEFLSVSAGGSQSCAIRADGQLACWGDDSSGQVSETPSGEFLSVSAGGSHNCATGSDSAGACWGDNSKGQVQPRLVSAQPARAVIGSSLHPSVRDHAPESECGIPRLRPASRLRVWRSTAPERSPAKRRPPATSASP